jgi:hypothetical protein
MEKIKDILNQIGLYKNMIKPIENKDYVPSFNILKWQANCCGYRLIPNSNQRDEIEDETDTGEELPF